MDKKMMLIQLIQQYEDGNKTRFAKRLGLTPQGISTWLSRGTIDYELVYAKCEHLNAAWLLTGEGSMLHDKSEDRKTEDMPIAAPSDAVVLRLMDKIDEKDAKIDQLQIKLRQQSEELAILKAKYPAEIIKPPKGLGSSETAKNANTKKHIPGSDHTLESTNLQTENL